MTQGGLEEPRSPTSPITIKANDNNGHPLKNMADGNHPPTFTKVHKQNSSHSPYGEIAKASSGLGIEMHVSTKSFEVPSETQSNKRGPAALKVDFNTSLAPAHARIAEDPVADVASESSESSESEPPVQPVHERPDFKWLILWGCILTMAAGYINAVSILSTGRSITHTSGATTNMAVSVVKERGSEFLRILILLGSFFVGSTISGAGVGSNKFVIGHRYGIFLIAVGILICMGAVVLHEDFQEMLGLALWAGAAGMQNALCTSFSGAVIRTTHTTGMLTDIGMCCGHWLRAQVTGSGKAGDTWKLRVLTPQYFSFWIGGLCGAFAQEELGSDAAFVPGGLLITIGVVYILAALMGLFDDFLAVEKVEDEIEHMEHKFHVALHNAIQHNEEETELSGDHSPARVLHSRVSFRQASRQLSGHGGGAAMDFRQASRTLSGHGADVEMH